MGLVARVSCRGFIPFTVVLAVACAGFAQDRIDHLIKAAAHLEQAGCSDMAADIRKIAELESLADRQRLIQKKMEQLRQLQAEVEQLRTGMDALPQISLRLKVLEFSPAKLDEKGIALVSIRHFLESTTCPCLVDETGSLVEFIDFLHDQGLIKVICEPTMVTAAGRPASFIVGQVPPSGQPGCTVVSAKTPALGEYGIRFDCTANIADDKELDLAISLRQANPNQANPAAGTSAKAATSAKPLTMEGHTKVQSGQRVILCGRKCKDGSAEETGIFIVLSAQLVQVDAQ